MVTYIAERYGNTSLPDGFLLLSQGSTIYTERSPTHFVATGAYDTLEFTGSGFTYDGAGRPVAGTIDAIDASRSGLPAYHFTGLSLPVARLAAVTTVPQLEALMADILSGNDRLVGSATFDQLHGFGGKDTIVGRGGSDYLFGGDGRDKVKGGGGRDSVDGGRGTDRLDGGADNDTLVYDARTASLLVKLKGAEWSEVKVNGRVEDLIRNLENVNGSHGDNKLIGDDGANFFRTFDGDDILKGGGGNDEFRSGKGLDKLTGGGGRDIFYISDAPDAHTIKTITDFRPGTDTVALNFSGLSSIINPSGALQPQYFHRGASAADGNDHIIYNPLTGRLYVDYDGFGGSPQILMAKLDPGLSLTNGDFQSYLL